VCAAHSGVAVQDNVSRSPLKHDNGADDAK
jgi:hypothetical protein